MERSVAETWEEECNDGGLKLAKAVSPERS
jgi:hypothetical protein